MQDSTPETAAISSEVADEKNHFFLFTVQLHFRKDDSIRHRTVNIISESPSPMINQGAIREAQVASINRLEQENQIKEDSVLDVIILNINYLGSMTQGQFFAGMNQSSTEEEPKASH